MTFFRVTITFTYQTFRSDRHLKALFFSSFDWVPSKTRSNMFFFFGKATIAMYCVVWRSFGGHKPRLHLKVGFSDAQGIRKMKNMQRRTNMPSQRQAL